MRRSKFSFKPKIGTNKSNESVELNIKQNNEIKLVSNNEVNLHEEQPEENIGCVQQDLHNLETPCLVNSEPELINIEQKVTEETENGYTQEDHETLNLIGNIICSENVVNEETISLECSGKNLNTEIIDHLLNFSPPINEKPLNSVEHSKDIANDELRPSIQTPRATGQKQSKCKTDYNEPLPDILGYENQNESSNLTMKDLVFKNPQANPMKSPVKSNVPTVATNIGPSTSSNTITSTNITSDSMAKTSAPQATLAPKVKIGPDGNIIIDNESLYVPNPSQNDELFAKPAIQEEYDPFSYVKYFKKSSNHKIWNREENIRFYQALGKHGINLTAITQEFPNRQRIEVKKKFKREEKINGNMIDIALAQNPKLDYFLSALYPDKSLIGSQDHKTPKKAERNAKRSRKKSGSQTISPCETSEDEYSLISEQTSLGDDDVISANSSNEEIIVLDDDGIRNSRKSPKLKKVLSNATSVSTKSRKTSAPSLLFGKETDRENKSGKGKSNASSPDCQKNNRKKRKQNKLVLTHDQFKTANNILKQITGNKIKNLTPFIPATFDKRAGYIQSLFGPYQEDQNDNTSSEYLHAPNAISEETVHDTPDDCLSILERNITNAIQEGLAQDSGLEENIASGQVLLLPQQYYIKNQIYQVYLVPVPPSDHSQEASEIT